MKTVILHFRHLYFLGYEVASHHTWVTETSLKNLGACKAEYSIRRSGSTVTEKSEF